MTKEKIEVEEVTEMDLIYENSDRLDALIEVLIDKKIITEHEYNKKLDEILNLNEEN